MENWGFRCQLHPLHLGLFFLQVPQQNLPKCCQRQNRYKCSAAFNSFDSFYNELTTASYMFWHPQPPGTYYSILTRINLLSQYMLDGWDEQDIAIMLQILQSFSPTCWRKKFLQIFQSVARHPQLLCWHVATIPSSLRWLSPDPSDPSDPSDPTLCTVPTIEIKAFACAKVGLSPNQKLQSLL